MAAGDAQAASASSSCGQLRYTKRGTTEMDNGSGWMDASRWPLRVVPRLRGCDAEFILNSFNSQSHGYGL